MTAREPLLKPSKPSKLPLHRRSAGHTFKTLETGIKKKRQSTLLGLAA